MGAGLVTPAVIAVWTLTMTTLSTIHHGFLWLVANVGRRDDIAKARHADHLRQLLSLNQLFKDLIVLVLPVSVAGAAGVTGIIPHALFSIFVGNVYEGIIAHKAKCGSWATYFRELVIGVDGRTREWQSDLFDRVEEHITEELRCVITHNIV